MDPHEPPDDELEPRRFEWIEEMQDVARSEEMLVCRILFYVAAGQSTQPVLQAVGIGHGTRERPAGSEYPADLRHEPVGRSQMLEELRGHDDVEIRVRKGEWLFHVGPDDLDPELLGLGESATIDVDADDVVAVYVGAREGAGAAAQVEDPLVRPADDPPERLASCGASPDERRAASSPAMGRAERVQGLEPADAPV